MAYSTGTQQSTISLGNRLGDMFRDLSDSYGKWRTYRNTTTALDVLSDRELHDLGMTRDQIHMTAMKAAYGEAHPARA